jgi:AcrR family transcriptional regulator
MGTVTTTGPTSAAPVRGRPRSTQCDQAIVEATLAILAEEGYAPLTMAGVASRAGVSTATLYRRWDSKEELVIGALATMSEQAARDVPDTGSLRGDITAVLTRMTEVLTGPGGRIIEGMLSETIRNKELAESLRARLLQPRFAELGAIFDRAAERGEIPPVADVSIALSLITGPIHQRLLVTGELVNGRVIRELVDLLTRAFGTT